MQKLSAENLDSVFSHLAAYRKIFVAYSGGVDSHVLLDLLVRFRDMRSTDITSVTSKDDMPLEIFAIHINHDIHPDADQWAAHCQQICAALKVKCLVEKISVNTRLAKSNKESLEAVARKLRHQALGEVITGYVANAIVTDEHTNDVDHNFDHCKVALVTAHHADDQAETLLLQLLRGAGPKGLAAMGCTAQFKVAGWSPAKLGYVELLRPLLSYSREMILQYAIDHRLKWIEDSSNLNLTFGRNYLRHQVMPPLKNNWPGVLATLHRAAVNCYESNYLAEALAQTDLAQCKAYCSGNGNGEDNNATGARDTLTISKLLQLDSIRQRNVLRYFLQQLHLPLPSRTKIEEIQRAILFGTGDTQLLIQWQGAEVRRYQDCLYAMSPLASHDPNIVLRWDDVTVPLVLPHNLGVLCAKNLLVYDRLNFISSLSTSNITVRFRTGGERVRPGGSRHHRTLKNLMQQWQVPPWLRDRIPLIYQGDEIIEVVGYCACIAVNI